MTLVPATGQGGLGAITIRVETIAYRYFAGERRGLRSTAAEAPDGG